MKTVGILYTLDAIPEVSWNPGDDIVRDGQRFLLESLLGRENIRWQVVNRNNPGAWFGGGGGFTTRVHPKLIYPYWWLKSLAPTCPPASCDYLINASGPLLYYGARCNTRLEPWYAALSRILRSGTGRPQFLNLAFGTNFAIPFSASGIQYRFLAGAAETLQRKAAVTTCRESHAVNMLRGRGITAPLVPCPSLLGRLYHGVEPVISSKGYLVVNLHPRGTRSLSRGLEADERWRSISREFLLGLQRFNRPIRLVFHEILERDLAERYFPEWMEGSVLPQTIPDYLRVYGEADFAVTSRIHGAYAAASMGVASVCVISDSRGAMIDQLEMPTVRVSEATAENLLDLVGEGLKDTARQRERLLALVESTGQTYRRLLSDVFEKAPASR